MSQENLIISDSKETTKDRVVSKTHKSFKKLSHWPTTGQFKHQNKSNNHNPQHMFETKMFRYSS